MTIATEDPAKAGGSIPQLVLQHEDKTYKMSEIVQSEVKNMLGGSGTGDIDNMVLDAFMRAAKQLEGQTSDERTKTMMKALQGDEAYDAMPIAKGVGDHWAIQALQNKKELPADPIGKGKVWGKTLLYAMRCFQERGQIDWKHVADDAKAKGHRQISDLVSKSLAAGDLAQGGVFVPSAMAADIIPYLEDKAVIRSLGARVVEMPNGNLDFGRINSTVSASWVGETGTANASTIGTDEVRLVAKKLKITVVASNDLIRQSPRGIAEIISDMSRQRAAAKEDVDMLRNDGNSGAPRGIYHWTHSDNKFNSDETDLSTKLQGLFKMIRLVAEGTKDGIMRGGFIMALRTKYGYMAETDANHNLTPLTQMMSNGNLFGFPFRSTTGIPTNLGSGDKTETYFGDFGLAVIGETLNMRVEQATEATITDEDGNPKRLWDEDQRAIRLIHEVDFAVLRDKAFAVMEDVGIGV